MPTTEQLELRIAAEMEFPFMRHEDDPLYVPPDRFTIQPALFPVKEAGNNGAFFSDDRQYRYALWRIWDDRKPLVMFIGLNPSTANESADDPTIKSVTRIAKHNGFGGFYMMNCWAYVSTDPNGLVIDIVSACLNDNLLLEIGSKCKDVVFAWGSFSVVSDKGRDKELTEMFPQAKALHINKNGSPKHPLYCKSNTVLVDWK